MKAYEQWGEPPMIVETEQPQRLRKRAVAGIIVGNLIPVFGVLFMGWDAGAILILYWIENFIVGAFTVPRILTAQGPAPAAGSVIGGTPLAARMSIAVFFCVHYGIFWAVHGVFTFLLAASFGSGVPGDPFAGVGSPKDEAASFLGGDLVWTFGLGVLALIAIHAVSFWRDWIRSDLRRTATPAEEMGRPYGRLIVLHVTILLGAFGLASVGAPGWTMLLLCVGKMVIELAGAAGKTWFATKPVDQST